MNDNVRILTNQVLEFASALYILGNSRESLSLSKEIGYEPDRLLFEMGELGAKVFSEHMQREAYYFMLRDARSMTGMSPLNALPFAAALDNPDICGVQSLIERLEGAGDDYIIYLLAKSALGVVFESGLKPGMLDEYIKKLPPEDKAFSLKLQECVKNPHETKVRFCLLLRQFYELVYKPFEAEISSIVEVKKPYYEKLFSSDPSAFAGDYLKIDLQDYDKKLDIYLSLFMQIGLEFLPCVIGFEAVMLGIHSDKRFGIEVTRSRLKSFYKLLADEKRFQLFELLSQGPKYVNELAELLKLSPPTVSHHISYFIRAGVVKPSRDEHRLYYALDNKKIREYFERSMKLFIKE